MSTTNVSTLDPVILAVFGSPPDGTDLSEEQYVGYDVVSCVVLGLAAAAVALRFWVRMSNRASLAMDDWTILIALVSLTDEIQTPTFRFPWFRVFCFSEKGKNERFLTRSSPQMFTGALVATTVIGKPT